MYTVKEKWVLLLMFGGILFYTGIAGSVADIGLIAVYAALLYPGPEFSNRPRQQVFGADLPFCRDAAQTGMRAAVHIMIKALVKFLKRLSTPTAAAPKY